MRRDLKPVSGEAVYPWSYAQLLQRRRRNRLLVHLDLRRLAAGVISQPHRHARALIVPAAPAVVAAATADTAFP
jgi:hypothetical protein